MPKVKYLGPTHALQVDDIIVQRGGEVELTDEQLERARGAAADMQFEVDGKPSTVPGTQTTTESAATPTAPVQPRASATTATPPAGGNT